VAHAFRRHTFRSAIPCYANPNLPATRLLAIQKPSPPLDATVTTRTMEPYNARFSAFSRPPPLKPLANATEVERKRRHNAMRLRNRFDSIIQQYSQDFTEVGDVIDLRTEKLIVDNGHLKNMRGELDPAYDQVWVGTDSSVGDEDIAENDEDNDELCSDMVTLARKPVEVSLGIAAEAFSFVY
jgi:hypothetical protein